jgi:O-antigen/teichoic acid export membrane protein
VQTISYFLIMCVALIVVIRKGGVTRVRPDTAVLRNIIITGLPFAVVVFAMTLYWRIDSVLIERLLPDGALQAGIYAQAFRLFDAIAMIPVMFGGLLLPIMSKELASGSDIRPLVSMAGRMLLAPLGIGAVILATFPGELLDLLYTSPAREATRAFTLLMMTLIPVGTIYIFSTILTAAGRMKLLGLITLSGMVLSIVLNLFLIPRYQVTGAACAAIITQTLVALGCLISVENKLFRVVVIRKTLLYILMLIVTFGAGLLLKMTDLSWVRVAVLQLLMGIVFALAFRMIEPLQSLKLIARRPDSI